MNTVYRLRKRRLNRPNDCRINCKTASHSDRTRGTPVAPRCSMAVATGVPPTGTAMPAGRMAGGQTNAVLSVSCRC